MEGIRKNTVYISIEENRGISFAWFLIAALLLHSLIILFSNNKLKRIADVVSHKNDPIIIDALDETQRKPIVRTQKSEETYDDKNPAPFHAEERNRVKRQTRAPLIGQYQEGRITPQVRTEAPLSDKGEEAGDRKNLDMHELMSFARTPHAFSKEIPIGGETILNTDKVLYASFINRIADEIYEPWVQYAQDGMKEVFARGRKIEPTTYITKLNVVMDAAGEVVAMTVRETSTINELDDAPKKAFWKIARFPNPPSQLIDKDGLIRLNYEFHFEWRSSFYNIVPYTL